MLQLFRRKPIVELIAGTGELNRTLGAGDLVMLAIGAVIGAGITGGAQTSPQLRQVAYIKASNTEMGDHFGNGGTLEGHGVALSGDGNTLAVGAPYESSGAKGVHIFVPVDDA